MWQGNARMSVLIVVLATAALIWLGVSPPETRNPGDLLGTRMIVGGIGLFFGFGYWGCQFAVRYSLKKVSEFEFQETQRRRLNDLYNRPQGGD